MEDGAGHHVLKPSLKSLCLCDSVVELSAGTYSYVGSVTGNAGGTSSFVKRTRGPALV